MSDSPPHLQLTADERRRQSLELKRNSVSDLSRWSDERNLDRQWNARAQFVANLIKPPATVIDLGCGSMVLKGELQSGVGYIPADLVRRDDSTHVFDFNAGELPDVDADVAVALGLLEYLHEPARFFLCSARKWERIILSYHPIDVPGASSNRLAKGWLNDLKLDDISTLAQEAEYKLEQVYPFKNTDRIFDFRRTA